MALAAGFLSLTSAAPGLAGPDACDSTANTATCSGDQSDGIASGSDGVEADDNVLIVESLTANIAPANDVDGVHFTPFTADPISVDMALGGFAILTTGDADGVLVQRLSAQEIEITQETEQENQNAQVAEVDEGVGMSEVVEQEQEVTQVNVSAQESEIDIERAEESIAVDVTGAIDAGAAGIVAQSLVFETSVSEQSSEQTNGNAQTAGGTAGELEISQAQEVEQSNVSAQSVDIQSNTSAGDVAVTYSGALSAGDSGIVALSGVSIDASLTQDSLQNNDNAQSSDATALDAEGGIEIEQGQLDELPDPGVSQENVTAQTATISMDAAAGNVSIDSSGPIAAGGDGLSARSLAEIALSISQESNQENGNSQSADVDGFSIDIDQDQIAEQSNIASLAVDVTATATSGDAAISSEGDVDAAGVALDATSSADIQTSIVQIVTQSNDNDQLLTETGASSFLATQDQTVTQTNDTTIDSSVALISNSGDVEVTSLGDLTSGSDAILAQSLAIAELSSTTVSSRSNANEQGADTTFDATQNSTVSQANQPLSGTRESTATATAGDVQVESEGEIVAAGNGIVARSVATAAGETATATSGSVTVTQDGDVTAGMNGILAESLALASGLTTTEETDAISVTVEGGSVMGGDGYYGVRMHGGTDNTFTNYGSVSSVSNQAIFATFGNDTVDNHGMVVGDVALGAGSNAFNNLVGGLYYSSAIADLGGGLLTNDGTLDPGGPDTIQTTALSGGFTQSAGGDYAVDVDMAANTSDRIDATGSASVNGTVTPNLLNLASHSSTTILTASGGVTDNGLALGVSDSFFIDFELLYPTSTEVLLEVTVDLTPDDADLNDNQSEIGDHLTESLEEGIPPELADLYAELLGITDPDELAEFYDALSPEVFAQLQTLALYGAADFADAMMSCGGTETPNAAIREGECVWMQGGYRTLDRDGDSEHFGYEEEAWGISGGVQAALDANWRLGFAGGYERSDLDSQGGEAEGDHIHSGAVLKYNDGPLLLAGGVSGGYAWYDSERATPFGTSSADPELWYVNGRLRAAYLFEPGGIYVKPLADLNVTYLRLNDFQESGGGGASLDVEDSEETVVSFSPAVEIGGDAYLGEGAALRPFARVGMTIYSETELGVGAVFDGSPAGAGPFQVTTEIDRVVGDVALGVEYFTGGGLSFRLGYDGRFSDALSSHALNAKAAIAF